MDSFRLASPGFVLALAVLAAGCRRGDFHARAQAQAQAQAGARTGAGSTVLTYPLTAKSLSLDPGKAGDAYAYELLQNVSEGLVAFDRDFRIVPWLARSWDVKDGGRTYVFHIRPGVRFTNGRKLVADDFRWNWERVLAPRFGMPDATLYFSMIQGANAYAAGKAKSISGVRVVDPHTLEVRLTAPRWYFLNWMTGVQTGVLAREAATEREATKPSMVVGTGPYRIVRYRPDQEVELAANADYWHGRPHVDRVVRPILTDPATRLAAFQTGDVDYVEIGKSEVGALAGNPRLKALAHTIRTLNVGYVALGEKAYPPFRNVHVRRAFALAVDRPHLIRALLPGQREAKGFVPPEVPGYAPVEPDLPYDPAQARRELAMAGFPDGKGLPPVEIAFNANGSDPRIVAEALVGDLRRNLGVDARTRALELNALLDRSNRGALAMVYAGWFGTSPQDLLSEQFTSCGSANAQGFRDATIDAWCAQADVEQDPRRRLDLYGRADRRAVELAARIPLIYGTQTYLLAPRVRSLPMNAQGTMPLFDARVDG